MYLNKAKLSAIASLLLTAKVAGKQAGKARVQGTTQEWQDAWDTCEFANDAILAMLGNANAMWAITTMAEQNTTAKQIMERMV